MIKADKVWAVSFDKIDTCADKDGRELHSMMHHITISTSSKDRIGRIGTKEVISVNMGDFAIDINNIQVYFSMKDKWCLYAANWVVRHGDGKSVIHVTRTE